MEFSYKKTAAAVIVVTLLLTSLLLVIAYRSENTTVSSYILKDYNGTVALYKGQDLLTVYDGVVLSSLPLEDRVRFGEGIAVDSPEDADSIIEDYDG